MFSTSVLERKSVEMAPESRRLGLFDKENVKEADKEVKSFQKE